MLKQFAEKCFLSKEELEKKSHTRNVCEDTKKNVLRPGLRLTNPKVLWENTFFLIYFLLTKIVVA